jgi:phosphohistidine phosphatase
LNLYFIRHAVAHKRDADRWPDDARRPLTPEGEERFRRAAGGILRLVPDVGAVLSSPFVRAWRTAEILEQRGWPAPISCEELEPNYPPHEVLDAFARYPDAESVAIVGHRPQLHELVSYLLTGDAEGARVQIKKGGAVCLSFDSMPGPGMGYLEWLLTPKALRVAG